MKISVIGGGGVRSMFLAKSLAQASRELGFDEIVFMDNDEKKLNIYGRMAQQLVKKLQPELNFSLTSDAVEAIRDADYIITTIRVGEDDMRIRDERIALDKHLLGQETTGAAGFSFAMRSVPALANYCELAKQYALQNRDQYHTILFVTYTSSLEKLFCDKSSIVIDELEQAENETEEAFFLRK